MNHPPASPPSTPHTDDSVEFSNINLNSEKEEELGLVGSRIHYFTGGIIIGIAENLLSNKNPTPIMTTTK